MISIIELPGAKRGVQDGRARRLRVFPCVYTVSALRRKYKQWLFCQKLGVYQSVHTYKHFFRGGKKMFAFMLLLIQFKYTLFFITSRCFFQCSLCMRVCVFCSLLLCAFSYCFILLMLVCFPFDHLCLSLADHLFIISLMYKCLIFAGKSRRNRYHSVVV